MPASPPLRAGSPRFTGISGAARPAVGIRSRSWSNSANASAVCLCTVWSRHPPNQLPISGPRTPESGCRLVPAHKPRGRRQQAQLKRAANFSAANQWTYLQLITRHLQGIDTHQYENMSRFSAGIWRNSGTARALLGVHGRGNGEPAWL